MLGPTCMHAHVITCVHTYKCAHVHTYVRAVDRAHPTVAESHMEHLPPSQLFSAHTSLSPPKRAHSALTSSAAAPTTLLCVALRAWRTRQGQSLHGVEVITMGLTFQQFAKLSVISLNSCSNLQNCRHRHARRRGAPACNSRLLLR